MKRGARADSLVCYRGRGRKGRSRLLDEVCALCGYERKDAIKPCFAGRVRFLAESGRKRGGSVPRYGEAELAVLKVGRALRRTTLWKASLHAALPNWLPSYEKRSGELSSARRGSHLPAMSPASIDRLPAPCRASVGSSRPLRNASGHFVAQPDSHRHRTLGCEQPRVCRGRHGGPLLVNRWRGSFARKAITVTSHPAPRWTQSRRAWNRGQHLVHRSASQRSKRRCISPSLRLPRENGRQQSFDGHPSLHQRHRPAPAASNRRRPSPTARTTMRVWSTRIPGRMCVNWSVMGGWKASVWPQLLNDLYAKEWSCFLKHFSPSGDEASLRTPGGRQPQKASV